MIKSKSSRIVSLCVAFALILTSCNEQPRNIPSDTLGMEEQEPLSTTVYASQNRPDVRGQIGAVSAGHPLAAQAGLRVLQDGGNATDAIIAMAGVLAVVRPHMNGIGGDAFGIFYNGETGEVTALNASGRSGALATPEFFAVAELDRIPSIGPLSVSVPGAVAGWIDAHDRYGSMNFAELLSTGIDYARNGFAVSSRLAQDFEEQGQNLNDAGRDLYLPNSNPPKVGSLLRNPQLANSLEIVADQGKEGFYNGSIAQKLSAFITEQGGYLRQGDFASHTSTWVTPLRGDYLNHEFVVMPPNTQGVTQLALFEMAKSHDLASMTQNSADYLHTLVELKKLAFADRDRWVADPNSANVPVDQLLDADYLKNRAQLINMSVAAESAEPGFGDEILAEPNGNRSDAGDTVFITAVDQWGNAVSWIQSNFAGFGSGLLDEATGILLHNRGALFTLETGHPNQVAPDKRPYHTLSPTMALYPSGEFAFTLGTPGGDSQTQTILQITHNMLVFGMTPQQAIEAPRFRSLSGLRLAIEDRVSEEALLDLRQRGHLLNLVEGWTATFGGAHMIHHDPETGVLTAAADPRREAYAIAY
ncbi:MAG: gamma-glutamyltransferase [Gammaproteobacteria bacterium]|nr:MAG: gamma-glutamyltransferase [Gammaproteobacteria bacterium]